MLTALITGPGSGIGKATALALGARGFHVIAAGRSHERMRPLIQALVDGGGSAEYLPLDLASMESVRRAARRVVESGATIDVLVNNAGIGINRRGLTEDGFEIHFGINHLGHFLLTRELLDRFRPGTRVVTLSSGMHYQADGIDFERVRRPTRMLGLAEYSTSKLANVLFARELAVRHPALDSHAVHPGLVATRLIPSVVQIFARSRMLSPEQGADTVVWCATSAEVAHQSGLYYQHRTAVPPSPPAQDDHLAAELWERSEAWCA